MEICYYKYHRLVWLFKYFTKYRSQN